MGDSARTEMKWPAVAIVPACVAYTYCYYCDVVYCGMGWASAMHLVHQPNQPGP